LEFRLSRKEYPADGEKSLWHENAGKEKNTKWTIQPSEIRKYASLRDPEE